MIMYDSETKTKGNNIQTKDNIEPQLYTLYVTSHVSAPLNSILKSNVYVTNWLFPYVHFH